MFFYKKFWLTITIFLLTTTLSLGVAQSQSQLGNKQGGQLSKKKWKVIDGFRSAKFGMNEKQVLRAITKDFKIPSNKVKRHTNVIEGTKALIVLTPNLLNNGETADIVYILGYKSKKLVTINITWGKGVTDNFDPEKILATANLLRNHFTKRRYKREGFVVNAKFNDEAVIFFRGRDKKDRTIVLQLKTPQNKTKKGLIKKRKDVSLLLSYLLNAKKTDIRQGKKK
jgi:hypothetical protein